MQDLVSIIEHAFDKREQINIQESTEVQNAVAQAIDLLDKGIARVAVDVKGHVRERARHNLQHLQVPAATDLELNTREAGIDGRLDITEQHVVGVLDSEVGPGGYLASFAAEEPMEWSSGDLGLEGPPALLDAGFGERVALEDSQPIVDFVGGIVLAPNDVRTEELGDMRKDRKHGLGKVGGSLQGANL